MISVGIPAADNAATRKRHGQQGTKHGQYLTTKRRQEATRTHAHPFRAVCQANPRQTTRRHLISLMKDPQVNPTSVPQGYSQPPPPVPQVYSQPPPPPEDYSQPPSAPMQAPQHGYPPMSPPQSPPPPPPPQVNMQGQQPQQPQPIYVPGPGYYNPGTTYLPTDVKGQPIPHPGPIIVHPAPVPFLGFGGQYGLYSQRVTCPHCKQEMNTNVHRDPCTIVNWVVTFLTCLWCIFFVPNTSKVTHSCSQCGALLGDNGMI
jgi:LITAF-like zinc ribbon domain